MTKLLFSLIIFMVSSWCTPCLAQDVERLYLKDYRPKSIYRVPVTTITKAKFPVVDMHAHVYARTDEELAQWVKTMDQAGIEKTVILSGATGARFDSIYSKYSKYGNRFELWCGFDYTAHDEPGWSENAVRELERCFKAGARGVGELSDKGLGLSYSRPRRGFGPHIDDPRMKPLLKKCGELKMPINIHVAEPYWMYSPMDSTNDGLMNAYKWRIDLTKKGILGHGELVKTLEHAVRDNVGTTFVACHFANCEYDLEILAALFDKYSNFFADIAARFGETSPIPRYMAAFYEKYQDRLVYGTDMGMAAHMYETTFRILESTDEHFYEPEFFSYHWPLHGFGLKDQILRKVYQENAKKIIRK